MAEVTLESLSAQVAYLTDALHELLRRVPGEVAADQAVEYWPSAIAGQKIPKLTGNLSIDFTTAMMGGAGQPTPERDANLAAHDAEWANREFAGKYHAGEIDDAAAGFVYAYSLTQPGMALSNKLYYEAGLFAGNSGAIAQLKSRGFDWLAGKPFNHDEAVANYPDSAFKRDVLAVV